MITIMQISGMKGTGLFRFCTDDNLFHTHHLTYIMCGANTNAALLLPQNTRIPFILEQLEGKSESKGYIY